MHSREKTDEDQTSQLGDVGHPWNLPFDHCKQGINKNIFLGFLSPNLATFLFMNHKKNFQNNITPLSLSFLPIYSSFFN